MLALYIGVAVGPNSRIFDVHGQVDIDESVAVVGPVDAGPSVEPEPSLLVAFRPPWLADKYRQCWDERLEIWANYICKSELQLQPSYITCICLPNF
jgi:hypothetical protein